MRKAKVTSDPAGELAGKMIAALNEQRRRGQEAYPLTVERLAQLADSQSSPAVVLKAMNKRREFLDQVAVGKRRDIRSPVAFREDEQALVESPLLLEFLLRLARTPSNQAFSVADLKKKVTQSLKQTFQAATDRLMNENRLPKSIGWIWVKGARRLFLPEDLHRATRPSSEVARPSFSEDGKSVQSCADFGMTRAEFPQRFEDAFERLNRQEGSVNFVNLVDLRRALAAVPRPVFDAELRKLWSEGRYSLRATEGRFGISPEEREAGFLQEGTLLLFVSRNPR